MTKIPHICFIDDSRPIYNYFTTDTIEAAGGSQRQEYLLARSLYNQGHPISVLTGDYSKQNHMTYDGVDVWLTLPRSDESSALEKMYQLTKSIREINADVYFIRGRPRLLVACIFNPLIHNKHYLYSIANRTNVDPIYINKYSNIFRILYEKSLEMSDSIVAQTEEQRQILDSYHGIDCKIIPNGYHSADPDNITSYEDRRFVLWVGRINKEQKQPHEFLNLAEELPEIEFKMIGPPAANEDEYYTQIKSRALTLSNLSFEGFVPPDDIHEYYQDATALINTSKYEGFPNTFLEAWRYKVPVITQHYSLDDNFEEENIGICTDSRSKLVDVVRKVWNDIELQQKLGENGFKYFKKNYDINSVSSAYSDEMKRITSTQIRS